MQNSVIARYGLPPEIVLQVISSYEIKMIRNLEKDIATIRDESKDSSNQNWAMLFIGGALSSFLTFIALNGNLDYSRILVICLIFCTTILSIFFFSRWKKDAKRSATLLKEKQEQLDKLWDDIEARVEEKEEANEYKKVLQEEPLELTSL